MGLPRTNLLGCILALAASQPNFVYILMDDTDELLGSASLMTRTKALVGDKGATFSRFRTLSPKCSSGKRAPRAPLCRFCVAEPRAPRETCVPAQHPKTFAAASDWLGHPVH